MKKFILLFLLLAVGLSSAVYGQQAWEGKSYQYRLKKYTPKGYDDLDPLMPMRDTVIMRGEEIEVGGYLNEKVLTKFEITGYGKAKKSDYKKGYYKIKLKPKQTTTYEFRWWWSYRPGDHRSGRIVYVANTAEEKKMLEEKVAKDLKRYWRTAYQIGASEGMIKSAK